MALASGGQLAQKSLEAANPLHNGLPCSRKPPAPRRLPIVKLPPSFVKVIMRPPAITVALWCKALFTSKITCMKWINHHRIVASTLALLAVCATLASFSTYRGGDSFSIYLNDKLVFEQHLAMKEGLKSFDLSKAGYNDKLSVYFSHCGKPGKARSIAIKDEHNKTLKAWHFGDGSSIKSGMTCKVGDIMDLQKNKSGKLQLYYSSQEYPAGQLLAAIVVHGASGKTASR